ncbi:excalibur calcium-binding domain-containing protein [Devosia submarina]|nr:excalibur calcium-binding domain-containing protein [Devosia submarina]
MARTVGLAPAYRGQPGYHENNDADYDGIACEPKPRRY